MPTQLSTIKTPKEKYREIVAKEISKLKSGYGLTADELAKVCGLSLSQFRSYGFHREFKTSVHYDIERQSKLKYYVK